MRLRQNRKGTTLVECALIYPIVFLLFLGLLVGAIGVFRYQEMASLARRAARYASVHGTEWAKDTGNPAPSPSDIYNNVVLPNVVALDTSQLSYSITYNTSNSPYHTNIVNGDIVGVQNTVTVTLTYQWIPEAFLGGIKLTSTSVMPMSH
jgi:Flp pilus assembly protein TadG